MATSPLSQENVWVQKPQYDKAEALYYERLAKSKPRTNIGAGIWPTNKTNTETTKPADSRNQNHPNRISTSSCEKFNKKNKASAPGPEAPASLEEPTRIISTNSDKSKKFKPKEAKEEKNKAHKKQDDEKDAKCTKIKTTPCKESLEFNQQGGPQSSCPIAPTRGSLASEVAKARQHIKQSLQCVDSIAVLADGSSGDIVARLSSLEKENLELKNIIAELKSVVGRLDDRVQSLEHEKVLQASRLPPGDPGYIAICPAKPGSAPPKDAKDDDDDIDLFGSDSEGEDEEAARIREERLAAYAAKKSNKPALIAKSNIILDVKPWDDETDMKAMEVEVRKIQTDGLLWGAAKLVPLAYGIHKLQISCVVEDEKVSVDWLTEQLEAIEDFVQSVDIAAFNKV